MDLFIYCTTRNGASIVLRRYFTYYFGHFSEKRQMPYYSQYCFSWQNCSSWYLLSRLKIKRIIIGEYFQLVFFFLIIGKTVEKQRNGNIIVTSVLSKTMFLNKQWFKKYRKQ